MDDLSREQQRRNRESVIGWDSYAPHRDNVTRLILDAARDNEATLTVLGAGNCNDLDLNRLAGTFKSVQLVDLDPASVEEGVIRQGHVPRGSSFSIYEADLSGIYSDLAALQDTEISHQQIQKLGELAENAQPENLPEPASVVISTGLITQLVEAATKAVGEAQIAESDSPGVQLIQAVRRRHLRLLSELTQPGGTAILVTEVVSSDTAPEICNTPVASLPMVLSRCLAAGNFFTGLHPGILHSELTTKEFAPGFESVQATAPWLWKFTARTYAVVAFVARRNHVQTQG
jgi:hypothetical protein